MQCSFSQFSKESGGAAAFVVVLFWFRFWFLVFSVLVFSLVSVLVPRLLLFGIKRALCLGH